MSEVRCPLCQSREYTVEQEVFNPGCGCLGALIFGWWGLLLGLLGRDTYIVCLNCGHKWRPGRRQNY